MKTVPILQGLDDTLLTKHKIQGNLIVKHFHKNETMIHAMQACDSIYVVIKGTFIAYALHENGSYTTVFQFKKAAMIGANLIFSDSPIFPFTIYSEQPCEVLQIKKVALLDFLSNQTFMLLFIKAIASNSLGLSNKVSMFTQNTLRNNILQYLKHQAYIQKSSTITLPISKKAWADYLGVQRPSLFRVLKDLKAEGILLIDNKTITILIPL